jgi:hypothetical protein
MPYTLLYQLRAFRLRRAAEDLKLRASRLSDVVGYMVQGIGCTLYPIPYFVS